MPSDPKPLTRAEKQARTRAELLAAAEYVFRRHGFHGATVEEIASTAGYTRGAFYSNFASREELFVELLSQHVFQDYLRLLADVPTEATPGEQLRWVARALADHNRDPEQRWSFELWLELLAYVARYPEFAELAAASLRENRAAVAAAIAAREPEGRSARPADLDPRALASALFALDIGLRVQNLVDPDEVPLELYEPLFAALLGAWFPD